MYPYRFQYIKSKFLSLAIVRRIFKIKDEVRKVGHVMEAFNAAVADLEAVAEHHIWEAAAHAQEIAARTAAKIEAEAEAVKATNIAAKMKAVFE